MGARQNSRKSADQLGEREAVWSLPPQSSIPSSCHPTLPSINAASSTVDNQTPKTNRRASIHPKKQPASLPRQKWSGPHPTPISPQTHPLTLPLQSLRIVPGDAHAATFTHLPDASRSAPSAPGVHDTLRHGVGPSAASGQAAAPPSAHPLEARLRAWQATQDEVRMRTLRKTFGVAEPVRRGMELRLTRGADGLRPSALGGGRPGVHEDILLGRDASVDWEDVFTGEDNAGAVGFHDEMERKLKM